MADSTENPPFARPIEVERLRGNAAFRFDESPTEAEAEAIRKSLGLRGLRKMRFQGEISPLGKRGWLVSGILGASITQECVVSLEPVKTRVEAPVSLRFLPESDIEYDTPEDVLEDDVEALGAEIDLGHVAVEALLLTMPDYPRADSVQLLQTRAAPAGAAQMEAQDTKPFAGLEALRGKLAGDES